METIYLINQKIVNPLIVLLFAAALIYFIWGVYQYWVGSEGPENRSQGARHVLWGLIGMMIMFGVFAIINFILNSLGVDPSKFSNTLPL